MKWDKLESPSDADIMALADRQVKKMGLFRSRENNTLTLEITGGTIGDASMALLSQFPDLQDLSIYDEPEAAERTLRITSGGWSVLSRSRTMTRLAVINCPLQIEDVRAIGSMSTLEGLTLTHCDLTDEHIAQLVPLKKKLTYLCLNFNDSLADGCIQYLIDLRRLDILHLAHSRISAYGARELEKSLPKCHVQFV